MNQQSNPPLTLFDLLARNWKQHSAVRRVCFNDDNSLLAAVCDDGTVVFARMADNEPPEARISTDDGRAAIMPRQGKPAPLIRTRINGANSVYAFTGGGFLVAGEGGVAHVSRSGETVGTVLSSGARLATFDLCRATGALAFTSDGRLIIHPEGNVAEKFEAEHPGGGNPTRVAFSSDGTMIAAASGDCLALYRCRNGLEPSLQVPLGGEPLSLTWDAEGRWLALGVEGAGLLLVDVEAGQHVFLGDFPGRVADVRWCALEQSFVASGAFRVAAWSMRSPPFQDHSRGALTTGRTGMALVEAVAVQPTGRLVAAGYGNGQVVVCSVGAPDELVVRSVGGPVTSLQWTSHGQHLGLGDALGNVAIVSFPAQMFK
ncbi:hypothetical protein [Rhizobium sp. RHZ01]|uniref:WD40 repeat domain-containing protein n=1 Tax=Rhizobium sp. RHZ01 TaxID=2769304 RepID=UPI00177B2D8E|nr:hypothetical protein [Rhizobium sp. RHZ01]MBD9449466.1 hypothetical protein [Rhizobium sp. RHZ01]